MAESKRHAIRTLDRVKRQWDAHGRRDALAAILTPATGESGWNVDAFLETGRRDVARLMAHADHVLPHLSRRRAFDFGCGIGRLTLALAAYFDEVTGVDIASSMIDQARARNPAPDRIRYEVNILPDLRNFESEHYDLVCSWIVLQHMPPPVIRAYIPELVRLVSAAGLLIFQLPTPAVSAEARERFLEAPVRGGALKRSMPTWLVRLHRRVKYVWSARSSTGMAMYGLHRDEVSELVERARGRLIDIRADTSHGTRCPGFSYWVTR